MNIPVYVVNLPEHEKQWLAIAEQLDLYDFLTPSRITAVNGVTLPDVACRILTRNKWSVDHKGTLGCFLSHVRIWEIIASDSCPYALIVEDDVIFGDMRSLPDLKIPEQSEVIFCNDRLAYPGVDGLRPIAPAIPFAVEHRRALGSDGYLLSKAGAMHLLELVEQDTLFAHVDMRLVAYSLTLEEAEEYAGLGRLSANISALRRTYPIEHYVVAHSLYPPLVYHPNQPSRRQAIDGKSHVPVPPHASSASEDPDRG
jgi:GR25 family glycosyltransferase involved in LPS biosynthesis